MKEILVLMPLPDEDCLRLRRAAPSARFTFTKGERAAEETLERADAILGNLPPELLPQAKRLKWLQLNSAGADPYLVPGVLPAGVTLTSATGAYGPAVAEHMLAVTLSLLKKLPLYRDNQNQRLWRDEGPVKGIAGSLFLIVGFGDIGRTYGRMAHVLGGRVIGCAAGQGRRRISQRGWFHSRSWTPGCRRPDVTALFLPGGAQTAGLFSADRLARMKRGSLLLNGGRGGAVDTQALAAALVSGRRGAQGWMSRIPSRSRRIIRCGSRKTPLSPRMSRAGTTWRRQCVVWWTSAVPICAGMKRASLSATLWTLLRAVPCGIGRTGGQGAGIPKGQPRRLKEKA